MKLFYDLSKQEKVNTVVTISNDILAALQTARLEKIIAYFGDTDTYIRRLAYLSDGRIYLENKLLQSIIIKVLETLLCRDDFKVRQTVNNALPEKLVKLILILFSTYLIKLYLINTIHPEMQLLAPLKNG